MDPANHISRLTAAKPLSERFQFFPPANVKASACDATPQAFRSATFAAPSTLRAVLPATIATRFIKPLRRNFFLRNNSRSFAMAAIQTFGAISNYRISTVLTKDS